jgi:serine-type D-Ala-D-Ala carboxypeptidase/endopeptidase
VQDKTGDPLMPHRAAVAGALLCALVGATTGGAVATPAVPREVGDGTPIGIRVPAALQIAVLQRQISQRVSLFMSANRVEGMAVGVVVPSPSNPTEPYAIEVTQGDAYVGGAGVFPSTRVTASARVTASTQFEIGSVTKTFTGALLAAELAQGLVSGLSETLQHLVPSTVTVPSKDGQDITIGDLATQEGGLPDDPSNLHGDRPGYTEGDMRTALAEPLALEPGEDSQWQYSDFGFGVLGTVLANKYEGNQTPPPLYGTVLAKLVTGPLGMSSTYLETPTPQLAAGYRAVEQTPVNSHCYTLWCQKPQPSWDNTGAMAGGGGLISDLQDMVHWAEAETGFPNADSSFLPMTLEPATGTITQICVNNVCYPTAGNTRVSAGANGEPFQMGLAWQLYKLANGTTAAFKGGETSGFSSVMWLAPSLHYGVVLLCNDPVDAALVPFGESILEKLPET